jgi:hypothetical protein
VFQRLFDLDKTTVISDEAFFVMMNEMSLTLPSNIGRGFHEWWWGKVAKELQLYIPNLNMEIVEQWEQGRQLPPQAVRKYAFETALRIVRGDGMSEEDFYKLINFSYRYLTEGYFIKARRHDSVISWAKELFLFKVSTEAGVSPDTVLDWIRQRYAPLEQMRMMIARIAGHVAMEVMDRDDSAHHQKYVYELPKSA